MLQYLVFVGAAVGFFFGTLPYIKDTLSGKTKPNRVSWLMWSVAPLIAAAAIITDGVGWAVLPIFMSGFCPALVFISSFFNKNSYWKLEKFDYFCGFLSAMALVFWGITKEPVVAIIFAIVSDGFAAIPTLIKSWKYPETENMAVYAVSLISVPTGFAAVKIWNFSSIAFLIYLIIINILITSAILRGRFIKKNKR